MGQRHASGAGRTLSSRDARNVLDLDPGPGQRLRLFETKCTVGAIDPLGRINPNECILCLRCQMIYYDPQTCTILKRRASRGGAANAEISPGANP